MIPEILNRCYKWLNRCRSCDVDGIDKSFLDQFGNLKVVSRIKTVTEYRCDKYGATWVLANNARFISKVVRSELFERWKSRPCVPSKRQREILEQIIGVPDYDKKNIYFPCAIELPTGQHINKAILIATTGGFFGKFPLGLGPE